MSRRLLAVFGLLLLLGVASLQLPGRGALSGAVEAAEGEDWTAAEASLPTPGWLDVSAHTLHDAGVIAWRQEDPARALASWRAAAERSPRDARVQRAIAVARGAFDSRPRPVDDAPEWTQALSPTELAWWVLGLWIGASALALQARRDHAAPWPALGLGAVALFLSVVCLQGAAALAEPVVVTRAETPGRLLPEIGTEVRVTWPEGTELRVHQRRGPFVRVVDGMDTTAWIDARDVAWPYGDGPQGLDAG